MTPKDLPERLDEQLEMTRQTTARAVDTFFEILKDTLAVTCTISPKVPKYRKKSVPCQLVEKPGLNNSDAARSSWAH